MKLIKTVYIRRQMRISGGKKVTAVDEKYYKSAEEQLNSTLRLEKVVEWIDMSSLYWLFSKEGTYHFSIL